MEIDQIELCRMLKAIKTQDGRPDFFQPTNLRAPNPVHDYLYFATPAVNEWLSVNACFQGMPSKHG